MHKIHIRFISVKTAEIYETELDERLSFEENLKILLGHLPCCKEEFRIYDPQKKVFLNRKIPLKEFNISAYVQLYLFG